MTITELAQYLYRNERYQRQGALPTGLKNGSLPPPGHVNPYCEPGMDITGIERSDVHEIPVSSEMEQQMKDLAFQEMKHYYGMSGPNPDEGPKMIYAYCLQLPPEDRINASVTLNRLHRAEAYRLVDFVQSKIPGWQIGQAFDTSILNEYQQGVDTRA